MLNRPPTVWGSVWEPVESAAPMVAPVPRTFREFLRRHVWLADRAPDGTAAGAIPWEWWPDHDRMVADLDTQQRLIVLKARQLGLSWLLAARHAYEALTMPGSLAGVVSAGETEAAEFISKIRFVLEHLPGGWGVRLDPDNALEVGVAGGGRPLTRKLV